MIVLGAGKLGRTSLGIFLPRPPHCQVSPFTSLGGGWGAHSAPPRGAPPSSGPSGPACLGGEGGRLDFSACVHFPHQRRLVPSTKTVYPLAKPPKFDLEERSVQVTAATMHVAHNFEVL